MYQLHKFGWQNRNLKMSTEKRMLWPKWKCLVQSMIIAGDKVFEQILNFNYLGCDSSLDMDKDIKNKNQQISKHMWKYK